jgi:hypothetical protein
VTLSVSLLSPRVAVSSDLMRFICSCLRCTVLLWPVSLLLMQVEASVQWRSRRIWILSKGSYRRFLTPLIFFVRALTTSLPSAHLLNEISSACSHAKRRLSRFHCPRKRAPLFINVQWNSFLQLEQADDQKQLARLTPGFVVWIRGASLLQNHLRSILQLWLSSNVVVDVIIAVTMIFIVNPLFLFTEQIMTLVPAPISQI